MLPIFHFPMRDLVFGVGLVLLLGLGTGLLPAFQAGRLKIVDALRRSGVIRPQREPTLDARGLS